MNFLSKMITNVIYYDTTIEKNNIDVDVRQKENVTSRRIKHADSQKNSIKEQRRHAPVTNKDPKNDHGYEKVKIVREQKLYSALGSKETEKIQIFSDSIPKSIQMKEFNRVCKNGKAHLKSFPGATSRRLKHFQELLRDDSNISRSYFETTQTLHCTHLRRR